MLTTLAILMMFLGSVVLGLSVGWLGFGELVQAFGCFLVGAMLVGGGIYVLVLLYAGRS